MAASSTTSTVYINVIEDVINKVREEFINNGGPGESVLNELQGLWEMKMMHAGIISGPIDRTTAPKPAAGGPITPVHDLNVPYEGTEEYETPTADMLFPPTPLQTPIQTPLPGNVQTPLPGNVQTPLPGNVQTPLPGNVRTPLTGNVHRPLPGSADNSSMYNIPTGTSSDYPTPVSDSGGNITAEPKTGRPSPFMQPPSTWINQRPPLDVNVAYVEAREEAERGSSNQSLTQDFFMMPPGKRKREDFAAQYKNGFIPQQDGAGDVLSEVIEANQRNDSLGHATITTANMKWGSQIPQLDGPIPDPYDDVLSTPNIYNYQGVVSEDYNIANTPAPHDLQASTPAVGLLNDVRDDDDDDEPLNEDDDDDDSVDDVDEGDDTNTHHLVLAQFDKVTRTKSRWKCTLKDGIMHINNRDILFNKANGEFDF